MTYALGSAAPLTIELFAASGDVPAVTVTFNPQPSPLSLRAARRAVGDVLRLEGGEALERAGDAFTAAIIRHNLLAWTGIGGADGAVVEPTPDKEIRNDEGEVIGIEPGTISAFLADPRLVERADELYVLPWSLKDQEKNVSSPSPATTGAGAMQEPGTASSRATRRGKGAAGTKKLGRRSAPTSGTNRKATSAKPSGG